MSNTVRTPEVQTFIDNLDEGYWGEHPVHSVADWRYEVANNDTRQGYWEWVLARELEMIEDG